MKTNTLFIIIIIIAGCTKDNTPREIIIPNGDFEKWNTIPKPEDWEASGCPPCLPPFDTYIVKQVTDASHGQYAAKFIFNGYWLAFAENKFAVPYHPSILSAYFKCDMDASAIDTTSIKISLLKNGIIVDSGKWTGITPRAAYTKLNIPISQSATTVDSALIRIQGGINKNTILWVDNLTLQ
jgi:hypothetical protein